MGTMSSGPGARDELRAARRPNGSACRSTASTMSPHDTDAGRGRRRLAFRPLDEARRMTIIGTGDRRDHRQGPPESPASLLEAAEAGHRVRPAGASGVTGTDRADRHVRGRGAAATRDDLPPELRGPLAGDLRPDRCRSPASPTAAQVCEVEVDPETGVVEIVGYAAVDDVGRAVNPMILHGQTPWRHRPGRRPGAVGAVRLRPDERRSF